MVSDITFHKLNQKITEKPRNDMFHLVSHKWLAQKLIAFMKKKGWLQQVCEEVVSYETITVDKNLLMDLIYEQMTNYVKVTGKYPTTVIIGYQEMQMLHIEMSNIIFSVPLNMKTKINDKDARIFGMTLVVNPFINGVVVN